MEVLSSTLSSDRKEEWKFILSSYLIIHCSLFILHYNDADEKF